MLIDPAEALLLRLFPTVVQWNRLEGQPRTHEMGRALAAEVRDALWMVTRQWQMGELDADDAGSPIGATIHVASNRLAKVQAGTAAPEAYDPRVPLEARAEMRPIALVRGTEKLHLDLRLELGRRFARMLAREGLAAYEPAYRARYAFAVPPEDRAGAGAHAHPEVLQLLSALAGRALDGGDLLIHLRTAGARASDGVALADPDHGRRLDALGDELRAWFARQHPEPPAAGDAWLPARLEYGFSCAAASGGRDQVLSADGYPGGHLDWFAFDRVAGALGEVAGAAPPEASFTRSFIPTPVAFDGMPHPRYWQLEDAKVSFARVEPATTDLAKLLLLEFGLVYANDWFLLPIRLPVGALSRVRGLTVTNTFGERFWIERSGSATADAWQEWRMYTLAGAAQDGALFLAPAAPKVQDGEPLEELHLIRDEMANLVWAIEARVPLATGWARAGGELAAERVAYHRRLIAAAPAPPAEHVAPIHYRAMTGVPEHWIPLVPVHAARSSREIQLQRGAMLRVLEADPLPPGKVEPQTSLLRRGLDERPRAAYFVHEEEVPRAGTHVSLAFQRARGSDGAALVWLGVRKETGRGEGSSQLGFDDIASGRPG
jgi:hypothetical protein